MGELAAFFFPSLTSVLDIVHNTSVCIIVVVVTRAAAAECLTTLEAAAEAFAPSRTSKELPYSGRKSSTAFFLFGFTFSSRQSRFAYNRRYNLNMK